ncbi:hypothetical protein BV20DRAFT_967601 [Pilatotrama ljubarskyi]|nr:hypothetical protein BV20DRAFT_967601 [Pilatotrama ljubarskyi]
MSSPALRIQSALSTTLATRPTRPGHARARPQALRQSASSLPLSTLPCAMRRPLALAILLLSAGLAAAQSSSQCSDGLDKLNNDSGQTPCSVGKQMRQACQANPSSINECTCNTVMYSVWAACAMCSGDAPPDWNDWADDRDCDSKPLKFPPNIQIANGTIPQWAYLPLTEENQFDLGAAILSASGPTSSAGTSKATVAAQVAVPIAAGVGVALIATFSFWLYWRHRWRRHGDPRNKTLPLVPGAQSAVWRPWRWFYALWPAGRSRRLRPLRKDSDWAIDDDTQWLGQGRGHGRGPSNMSNHYHDPFMQSPPGGIGMADGGERDGEALEMDVPYTSAHLKETSSTSLLPRMVDLPDVRVPTFMERFFNFKDGLRKSASYKAKYVSPVSPGPQFRIDGSAGPTPVAKDFSIAPLNPTARPSPLALSAGVGAGAGAGSASAPGSSRTHPTEQVVTERSDFVPHHGSSECSVLLISRDGEDFTIDDTATTAPSHSHPTSPRTQSTFRQDSSAYSGTHSGSGTNSCPGTRSGTGSWLPSPNRANTASTLSGAYPTELRRDPDLASPRSWAARFPAPPHSFAESPTAFRSFAEQLPAGRPPEYHQHMPQS